MTQVAVKSKQKQVAVKIQEPYSLQRASDIMEFASTLQKFIKEKNLSCIIQGKNYVYVDGWKFAGSNFNLSAIPKKPINESNEKEIKYSCECEIMNMATSQIVMYGYALCSNKESKKKSFDEYAIASMAQTRAIAKAYRNLLGFVMSAAGFESTPAEEMEGKSVIVKEEIEHTLSEEIEVEILRFTDAQALADWANAQKELHSNKKFMSAVKSQIVKLKK